MHMHAHPHDHSKFTQNVLLISVVLSLIFAAVEGFAGWHSGSLALLSDAGHMMADGLALALAAFAAWIAKKPPTDSHTYGLGRAEIIGAWVSSLLVLGIAIFVIVEAIERLKSPSHVTGTTVIFVAFIGLVINILIAYLLSHGEKTLNTRAALLHVMGDLLGSVAALISGAVIYFSDWVEIDPILSIFISVLILISSFRLLRESLVVLMEGVPAHIDISEVGKSLTATDRVRSIHDLHVWTLSSGTVVLTAHIEIEEFKEWPTILDDLKKMLHDDYGIHHVTLQPETYTFTLHHMDRS